MSSKARIVHVLILVLLIFAACTQPPTPSVQIPTLAVLPSVTPTNTPTITPSPTPTDTPTEVPTATPTDTFTPSPTFTPSLTDTPRPTNTPTLTITPSPTNTPTAVPTATLTSTPIPSPTIAGPEIVSFGANMTNVLPNTTITLAWITQADSVRLDQLTQQGGLVQSYPASPQGQLSVVVPSNFGRAIFYKLTATRNTIQVSQTIQVNISCQFTWFFGDQYAPPGAGCPAASASGDGRYQPFERGVMFYVTANNLNRIYGVQNDSSLYVSVVNNWDGSTLNTSAAPSGRFIPQEMFNWVYYNTLAPVGTWNSALGWATSDIVNAPRTIQFENATGGSNPFYIDAPDGGIYRFSGGDSGTWSRVR